MVKKGSGRADYDQIISHLQIIRTWADVERKYGGIKPDCCEDIVTWIDDALELLKEQKGVPYVFNADGETVCGVCGCYFDKAYSNCPKCGKKVDWNA